MKRWANLAILKKSLKSLRRKLIISNSNKLQPLLNASKAWQSILAGSLKKWAPSKKHPKKKLVLVTELGEPKQNQWNQEGEVT